MIDELIEEEKNIVILRIEKKQQLMEQKNQLDSKIAILEERLKKLQQEIGKNYPVPVTHQKFNFFQKIFYRKRYKEYNIKMQQYDADYTIAKEEEELRKNEISTIKTDLVQSKRELLDLNVQINSLEKLNDNNIIKILEDKEKAIIFLLEKYPNLRNDLNFMKEIVLVNHNNLQYDETDNPELYLNVIQQLIDKYRVKALEDNQDGNNSRIVSVLEKYFEIIKPKEKINGKYRIPLKYLHESIRKNLAQEDSHSSDDNIYSFFNPIFAYCEMNDKFSQEYGEKMQELWEDNTIRLGAHGLKGAYTQEERRSIMNNIFTQGLRTSQQQIGSTDLRFTTNVQGYNPNANFLEFLNYAYQEGGFILLAIPEECFDEHSKKPIWGGNSPKAIGQEFVLPEYVLGYVPQDETIGTEEYYHNRHIIYNREQNRTKYKYFFKNGLEGKSMDCEAKEI